MKYWQYVVACIMVLGCSNEPVPEDSYFITTNDYNEGSARDLEVSISVDTTFPVVLPDSFPMAKDSLVLPEDSLGTEPDSLESDIDSLPPTVSPQAWRFIGIEIQGSLYQSLGEVSDVDPDILGAHCVRNLVWEMNPWRGFIAGDSMHIIYTTEELSRENMVIAFEYIPVGGSSNHGFAGYVFHKSGDNWPSVWKADGVELVKLLDRAWADPCCLSRPEREFYLQQPGSDRSWWSEPR